MRRGGQVAQSRVDPQFVAEVNVTEGSLVIDTLVVFPGSQYYADAASFSAFVSSGALATAITYDSFFASVLDDSDVRVLVESVQVCV